MPLPIDDHDGYTTQEIKDFWEMHHRRAAVSTEMRNGHDRKILKASGMFFYNSQNIIVLKDGQCHNPRGPASVIFNSNDGTIITSKYYLDDIKLDDGDIVVRMIKARDR